MLHINYLVQISMFRTSIIEALRNRFAGVSDAILNRIADKLDKTVKAQEEVATAVAGVTFQQVLESYGDSRATEAQQTAVRNYESKYGLKDGVKVDNGGQPQEPNPAEPTSQGGEQTPAWAKALIDSQKTIAERLNAIEGERTTATRKQKLAAIIEKLPENLRKPYDRTPVEGLSDEDFNSLLTEVTTEVESIVKDSNARGAVFGRPSAQSSRQAQSGELSKEQQDAIAQRDGVATGDKQPF